MDNITGRLQAQAKQLSPLFRGPEHATARVLVAEVNKSVRDIRQQIRHLEPQLRYQRARRDVLDIGELVERVVEYHRPRLAGNGIEVSVSGTAFTVRANRGRLQQALDNLVTNSEFWLRHADTSDPRIDVTLVPPRPPFHDNGPGVDPALAPAIFEPFVSGRSGEEGRGLGLFVTRQVLKTTKEVSSSAKLTTTALGAPSCWISALPYRRRAALEHDLVQLLDLLGIDRVVVVDDDFLAPLSEYLVAVEEGDAPTIESLPDLPEGDDPTEHAIAHWDEVTVQDKLEIRRATLKAKRQPGDPTGLRELIYGRPFSGLAMAEWEALSERLMSGGKRLLILFDVDFGQETGDEGDTTGLLLAREALGSAGKHIVGLLTSKAETGEEEATAAAWAQNSGVPVAEFVVVNKRLVRDGEEQDLEVATDQIRTTLQASQLARVRTKVKQALDEAISFATEQLDARSPSVLEDVVFESSHEGGEWEGDTWFRIYGTLGLDRARHTVALDPEVRAAISDVRQLLRSRPDNPHPDRPNWPRRCNRPRPTKTRAM